EKKDRFWKEVLDSVSDGVEAMILVSNTAITEIDGNKKKDVLMLHYLDKEGTVILKETEYTKKFLKGISFGEEIDTDPPALFYYLEPIAELYKKK
ncbi:MAG: hypothetical protein LBE48_05300, partial [Methanomassiliicoccaceae archaeon]|nr:hypothetical protein [Methanomassiliicoccaceae archaeon]